MEFSKQDTKSGNSSHDLKCKARSAKLISPTTSGPSVKSEIQSNYVSVCIVTIDSLRKQYQSADTTRPVWVSPAEWEEAEIITDTKRRWQWLAGRWVAKSVAFFFEKREPTFAWEGLGQFVGKHGAIFTLRSRDKQGRSCQPRVWRDGKVRSYHVSISHTNRLAAACCAVEAVGIDVVDRASMVRTLPEWLTPGAMSDPLRSWAAVEAAFKTGGGGVLFSPGQWLLDDIGQWTFRVTFPRENKSIGVTGRFFELESEIVAIASQSYEEKKIGAVRLVDVSPTNAGMEK